MMLGPRPDGTYLLGPYDVVGIMKDVSTGRYHSTLWLDHPLPGSPPDDLIRLKSKMHHTEGAETYEGAVAHVQEMLEKLVVDAQNVWTRPDQVMERDFSQESPANVFVVRNWRRPSEAPRPQATSGS